MFELTKNDLDKIHAKRTDELFEDAGSYRHLARMLDIPISTTNGWMNRGRVSKKGAKLVAEHPRFKSKFTANYLRPDL